MDSKVFAQMPTGDKWRYIHRGMREIQQMEVSFNLRRRFNPHHPKEAVEYETKSVRAQQYGSLRILKDLYAEFRDELANTMESEEFIHDRSILERLFTQEVDDALREIVE